MSTTSAISIQDEKFRSLGFSKAIVNQEQVNCYSRALGAVSDQNPILALIHGYPQSSYMWRHFVPILPQDAPIFVADLPGYGASAPVSRHDKLTVGTALLSALKTEVKRTSSRSPVADIPVILIGHDRGARVAHRLAVSGMDGFDIRGVCLIDIVPTSTQWQNFSNPAKAAKDVTGYFHWPLLANVDLATRMITAFGPEKFLGEMVSAWSGQNQKGIEVFSADESMKVYGEFFAQEHTLKASCEDYQHGATTDVEMQEEDRKSGRKIQVPLFLLYSKDYIGSRDEIGHFGAEEAPEESARVVGKWLKSLTA